LDISQGLATRDIENDGVVNHIDALARDCTEPEGLVSSSVNNGRDGNDNHERYVLENQTSESVVVCVPDTDLGSVANHFHEEQLSGKKDHLENGMLHDKIT
jgi:hypothetical protein